MHLCPTLGDAVWNAEFARDVARRTLFLTVFNTICNTWIILCYICISWIHTATADVRTVSCSEHVHNWIITLCWIYWTKSVWKFAQATTINSYNPSQSLLSCCLLHKTMKSCNNSRPFHKEGWKKEQKSFQKKKGHFPYKIYMTVSNQGVFSGCKK